jgi:hypothetical protein
MNRPDTKIVGKPTATGFAKLAEFERMLAGRKSESIVCRYQKFGWSFFPLPINSKIAAIDWKSYQS